VRTRSQARVVGITGATGKTTTKDILAALCSPHLRTIANEGNYNNELGVPLTLCRLEPDTELCIAEMAMRGLGQIAWLAAFARPDIAVITNIGPVHLELVGSVENVARAKAELVDALPSGGVAVVPDDPVLEPFLTRTDIEIRRVGPVPEPFPVETSYSARHQLQNTVTALAVCDLLGVPVPARLDVEFSPLREEEHELADGIVLLNDCYNANPISMRAALEHLVRRADGRRSVAVLGEMAELGPAAPDYHEQIGRVAAELGIDEVVGVGSLARSYLTNGGRWFASADEAAESLAGLLEPGDVVLLKGSRAAGLEAVAAKLLR
jgi:UDP-N-acetylmuramoyl-tripeptide--D-alanyl-D-alanine ligase